MTSLTIDRDGVEEINFAPTKMDSLEAEVSDVKISDDEWKDFANRMQIVDPERIKQYLEKSCKPKFIRRFFKSEKATRNLRIAAKLGKTDVVKMVVELGRTDVNNTDKAGQTALHYAAREGHLDIIRILLAEENINASLCNGDGNTALHIAAKHGNVRAFGLILRAPKVKPDCINHFNETPLILAARGGHGKIVDMLLEKPKLVDTSEDHKSTPSHVAAPHGHGDIVKKILPYMDVDSTNRAHKESPINFVAEGGHKTVVDVLKVQRTTPLHAAAEHGHADIVEKFLKEMDVNSTSDSGKKSILDRAAEGGHEVARHGRAIVNEKLLRKTDVNSTTHSKKKSSLHLVVEGGHEGARNGHAAVVEKPQDVNSTTHSGQKSPLHLAVEFGHEAVVDVLLKARRVNPSLEDSSGNTPLHIAAEKGNGVILEKLLQRPDMDVNSANKKGLTALHVAAKYRHVNIVKMLLNNSNIDLCAKTKAKDKTPLRMASKFGGVDVVQELLARNVDPCLEDNHGDTPLHLAAKFGHRDVAEALLAVFHFDMINKVNEQNETPLFLAASHGRDNVVDLLLDDPSTNLSICDKHDNSPFHVAVKGNHEDIAEKLLTHPRAVPIHANKENEMGLHLCIKGGYAKLVDILLKQSPHDAIAKDAYGNYPIHYATRNGNIHILESILNAPEVDENSVNSVNDHLDTPLHIAVKAGHDAVLTLLLQKPKLDASMRDQDGNSALHVAAKYDEEDMIELLSGVEGVDVNATNEVGVTALVLAAEEGHESSVDKLLKKQGTLNSARDVLHSAKNGQKDPSTIDWGVRSLLAAARNGHDNIVKSLVLTHGVNVNGTYPSTHSAVQGFSHKTALSEAIEHGRKKVVEALIEVKATDLNRRNENEEHPLFIAAKHGHKGIVKLLMDKGQIDVNVLSNGKTALQGAARNGREEVVRFLLTSEGIDVHTKNIKNGESALFYAARAGNKKILKSIYDKSQKIVESEKRAVETQLSINDKNDQGESIIHLAARKNLPNVIDFLLEIEGDDARSVDVNLKTSSLEGKEEKEQSALQIAIGKKHYKVVEKLTKFDNISFVQEDYGKKFLQQISDDKQWDTVSIVMAAPQVNTYIEALYKDRQASIDAANAILVGAALIAGVTFASWLQPPLGYSTYYHEQFSDTLPAPPIAYPEYVGFDHHPSLQAFWVFNSLSFFSAIATVLCGARSVLPAEKLFIKEEVEILQRNLLKTSLLLGFSMFFVLLAFATAGVVVLPPLMKFRANIFSTIGIGGSLCFIFLFLFGRSIYKLRSYIKSSEKNKKGFLERWIFKPLNMSNSFIRTKGSEDHN